MLRKDLQRISKEDLLKAGHLSRRAYNVCRYAHLNTLEDILGFYESGGVFKDLKNAGKKTSTELTEVCKNAIDQLEDYEIRLMVNYCPVDQAYVRDKFDHLDGDQRYLLELYYRQEKKSLLSSRSGNAIKEWTLTDFYNQVLVRDGFSFQILPGVGERGAKELERFKWKMDNLILKFATYDAAQIEQETLKVKYGSFYTDHFIQDFKEAKRYLPMFWILQKKISSDFDQDINVFKNLVPVFEDSKIELDSTELEFSEGKIRRICHTAFQKIFSGSNTLFEYKQDWMFYRPLQQENVITVNSPSVLEINRVEGTKFSAAFILQVLSFVFAPEVKIIGGEDWQKNESSEWKSVYLISQRAFDVFDFNAFRKVIKQKITVSLDEDEVFNLDDYLRDSVCWNTYDLVAFDEIKDIVLAILMGEFSQYPDLGGNITIPAYREYTPEVIYKMLKSAGRKMHLREVFEKYDRKYPNKFEFPNQLIPEVANNDTIVLDDSGFLGLREWETETKTIMERITAFLGKQDFPQSETTIRKYLSVAKIDCSVRTLRSVIRDGVEKKKIVFFEKSLIGLEDKEYPTYYVKQLSEEDLFDKMANQFEIFLQVNHYSPSATSNDLQEKALGGWWNGISNKALSEAQQKKVECLKEQQQQCYKNKREYQWYLRFNKLRDFIAENKYIPRPISSEKEYLNIWKRLSKDFNDNRLTEKQRIEFRNLSKLCSNASGTRF